MSGAFQNSSGRSAFASMLSHFWRGSLSGALTRRRVPLRSRLVVLQNLRLIHLVDKAQVAAAATVRGHLVRLHPDANQRQRHERRGTSANLGV